MSFAVLHIEGNEDILHSRFIAGAAGSPRLPRARAMRSCGSFCNNLGDLVWRDESRRIAAKEWIKTENATVRAGEADRQSDDCERGSGEFDRWAH